jgi:hypothetical protein
LPYIPPHTCLLREGYLLKVIWKIYFTNIISNDQDLKLPEDKKLKAIEHFKGRLNAMDIDKYFTNEPFKNSSETLYRFAPIADELKVQDRDIVLNSMILKWKHVTDDLKKNSKNFSI